MIKEFAPWQEIWNRVKTTLRQTARVWIPASAIAGSVIGLRTTGIIQPWELSYVDSFFQARPAEPTDDRIVIVGIREAELQQHGWPLSDRTLAGLLTKIESAKPRAIGLDIYRDHAVREGNAELERAFQTMPNLIGIQKMPDPESPGVAASPTLKKLGQVGFNNVIFDPDRKIRRAVLYWFENRQKFRSFSMMLALRYLENQGIREEGAPHDAKILKLGQAIFPRFQQNDGVYVNADDGGYQIIANFRGGAGHFRTVMMQDVLDGKVPAEQLRDRIVLIGSLAPSLKDFSATPFSGGFTRTPIEVAGVEIQANFISEILNVALGQRRLLKSWSEPVEYIWIWTWALIGTSVCWRLRSPQRSFLAVVLLGGGLTGICYGLFLAGWIVPFVPAAITLVTSATVVIAAIAHSQEELKRSKEFLSRVINSIPDPVFVKDAEHRWVVLNEAYSKLLGKPLEELIEKSDYEIFPEHEADVFHQQDELVFRYKNELEHEEEFTSTNGVTYHIATKRSLHKDAAGNLFLVGVIRDITQRKTIEEELRRTTEELYQSNVELRLSQDRLNYIANHDALTGLPNRILLYERIKQAIEMTKASNQITALLFLDLDGFKQINDTLGHAIGDLLLQAVARRLSGCLRTSDTVARLGGDEFVVLLPAIPDILTVTQIARKILSRLSQAFAISGQTLLVTTSIGIAIFPEHADDLELLIEKADEAMYHAKRSGKNQFSIADRIPVENHD
ncbi:CHASE2 domain-containing protein [Leptolyngbya boryana CZ1]|uniref:CHASE2 domain-containing protein n=1 Tax=Leptolyngbya boryana CZ1 TaxID=3060204 RepID=A0AA96WZN1_LEPBY|nr:MULTISPECIES: CHASE2 domain-containing protein [Leptolyngbya]MBD1855720.1 CHASE2 domain-containing protein [Leptolyngbya sp. FACHB-1624]WNZ48826.1 CHASE2 domain-containing protein [Leptolyngbya boryana CZ1]